MKKFTLAVAGLLLAATTFAAPCDKDKKTAACCKDKKEACAKKEAKADCKEKSCCKKSSASTAKK